MKSYTLSIYRIVQFVVCGLLLVAPGSGTAATRLRFRLAQDYLVVVPVTISGAGPFDFILDTGTTTTILDSELAMEQRLQAVDRLTLVTLTGEKAFPRSWLQSASLGEATAEHVEVVWNDLNEVKAVDRKIRGILGLNFLDGFNYLINYADRTVEVEAIDSISPRVSGARVPVDRTEGELIITALTRFSGQLPLRLGLDSGVGVPVIYTPASRKLPVQFAAPDSPKGMASTLTGRARTETAWVGTLDIGGNTLTGLTAAVIPRVDAESQVEDGVLPTVLFRSIYFNNKEGYVVLNPVIADASGGTHHPRGQWK